MGFLSIIKGNQSFNLTEYIEQQLLSIGPFFNCIIFKMVNMYLHLKYFQTILFDNKLKLLCGNQIFLTFLYSNKSFAICI